MRRELASPGPDRDAGGGRGDRRPAGTKIAIRPWGCREGYRIILGSGRNRKVVGSARTLDEAVRKRDQLAKQLTVGDGVEGVAPRTVGALLDRFGTWKASQRSIARSTATTYSYQVAALKKGLGDIDLLDLHRDRIEGFVASGLQAGMSPVTVKNEVAILRLALHYGNKRGWTRFDVDVLCGDIEYGEAAEKRWLRAEEVPVLLNAVDVDEDGVVRDPRFGIAVRLALFAGLRAGEVATRQWKDVDWHGGLLTVGPKSGKGWSWRTKNGKTRLVPISSDLRTALRAWWVRLGQPDGEGWIVPTTEGERRKDFSWLNEALHRICAGPKPKKGKKRVPGGGDIGSVAPDASPKPKDGGKRVPVIDPPLTFHGLRHSFASLALEAGVPLLEVSRILGHHSPEFTARQYAHVAERRLVAGAERLGEYLRKAAGN